MLKNNLDEVGRESDQVKRDRWRFCTHLKLSVDLKMSNNKSRT